MGTARWPFREHRAEETAVFYSVAEIQGMRQEDDFSSYSVFFAQMKFLLNIKISGICLAKY